MNTQHYTNIFEKCRVLKGSHLCQNAFQSHAWDNATPIEETLRTFDDLVRCGKIRYFGVSNVCGWQMQKIVDKIDKMGLNPCVTLQVRIISFCGTSQFVDE